ncbi:hypothetical protein MAR_011432 [Mya arenaria]|uniref:Uncharacterized protein n=1 Tax=Mya arenaria TaxID=6604 RepID=A0ABY7FU34_MYAAR|nr:hypothetical protein MAR_011432 [Mya arenaria]
MPVSFLLPPSGSISSLDLLDGPDIHDDLEEICDVIDAMTYCDEREIPIDGLDDIDEIKERIKLHFIKQNSMFHYDIGLTSR